MYTVQIEVLPKRHIIFKMMMRTLPKEGETVCFNYGSPGEFTYVVEQIIHVAPHGELTPDDPEIILRVTP